MIVRASTAADMPGVAALVRASFAERLHSFMTYAQPGLAAFLGAIVAEPRLFPDHRLLTCTEADGTLAGFAEFRVDGSQGFLSYICVTPAARRTGLARQMIAAFLDQHPALVRLDLDVFDDNEPALRLYADMGFGEIARAVWLARDLPDAAGMVRAVNPAGALAAFDRYGFCEMPVSDRAGEHRLGRIGPTTLRCYTAQDFNDAPLLAAVRALVPELATALVILPADQAEQPGARRVNISRRLSLDLPAYSRDLDAA